MSLHRRAFLQCRTPPWYAAIGLLLPYEACFPCSSLAVPAKADPTTQLHSVTHAGHYLGSDVHDVHAVSSSQPITDGVVFTIEPGLYLPHDPAIPAHYRGIGIRIEDDVALVDGAPEVLTRGCAKTVDAIEALMRTPPVALDRILAP